MLNAQVMTREDCPSVFVVGPLVSVNDGDSAVFSVSVDGDVKRDKIGYEWSVDNGQISSGAGTDEITVVVSGKPTATVKVAGIDEGCNSTVSLAARYGGTDKSAIFFDEFGKVKDKLLEKRIAAMTDALRRNPTTTARIISYGSADAVSKRESEIRNLAARSARAIDPLRIVFVNGGVEKDLRTRVWIVPSGVDAESLN